MRHMKKITRIPAVADSQGLCTEVNSELQARFCFVLAFLTDVLERIHAVVGDDVIHAIEVRTGPANRRGSGRSRRPGGR